MNVEVPIRRGVFHPFVPPPRSNLGRLAGLWGHLDAFDDLGRGIVAALGEPAAGELLDVITHPDADRAALIGRLHQRDGADETIDSR